MKALVTDVVVRFGGEAREEDGRLLIKLPAEGPGDELAKKLGQHELALVFEVTKLAQGTELVAPGSHVLRTIEEWMASRGRHAWVEAPAEHKLTLKAVTPSARAARGASLALASREASAGHDLYVVYRIRYRSLDRTDRLETVRVRLRPLARPVVDHAPPPDDVAAWPARPRKHLPGDELELALGLADEAVAARARVEGKNMEQEARRRSAKELSRLHAYYSGQIADLERSRRAEQAQLRIEELEDERALRIHELAATTHVRVEVEPLQLLVVEVPVQTARLVVRRKGKATAAAPEAEAEEKDETDDGAPGIAVAFDRVDGALIVPPCPACGKAFAGGIVDGCAGGHVVHLACLSACARCQSPSCAACGSQACAACGEALCPACSTACPSCEEAVCAAHVGTCGLCQKAGCATCLHPCAECGTTVCPADGCSHAAALGARAVLCTRCAVPCPACKTATAYKELVRCGVCGRKFCATCHPRDAGACALCRGGPVSEG